MPELPEVQTIVSDLKKVLPGLKIKEVWTDWPKMIKIPKNFLEFKKEIINKKILNVERKGKNILIHLTGGKTLLIHQKLTGHLLYGKYQKRNQKWLPQEKGPLNDDPSNKFLHLVLTLSNNKHLALSDLRKFAKILIWPTQNLNNLEDIKNLGPDPLEKSFTFKKFQTILKNKKGKIKQILMDQKVIAGIGNIYSDEILWEAKVHPFKETSKLSLAELKKIYQAIKEILKKAVKLRGESISDYRDIKGRKGKYDQIRKVYRREGKKCQRCGTIIKKVKMSGRSAHFCPKCQK